MQLCGNKEIRSCLCLNAWPRGCVLPERGKFHSAVVPVCVLQTRACLAYMCADVWMSFMYDMITALFFLKLEGTTNAVLVWPTE
jgi:hypothetical protein